MRRHLLLIFVVQPAVILAWHLANDVNFTHCFLNISNQSTLDRTNISDTKNQVFVFDKKTGDRKFSDRTLLTLWACEHFCHGGFDRWPIKDTFARIILWVVPAVVLVTRFHFAPLSGSNTSRVILHLVGDPIDSIWSMLTRQEANKRLLSTIQTFELPTEVERGIATIWAAYDEFGWLNPANYFMEALRLRNTMRRDSSRNTRTPPSQSPAPAQYNEDSASSSEPLISRRTNEHSSDASYRVDTKTELDEYEKYCIMLATHRITSNRTESKLTTLVAILGLVAALGGAFIRTLSNRSNNQTSHTIAVVSLFFTFIPIVWISSNIGAFTSPSVILDTIQELRRNLKKHDCRIGVSDRMDLFPPLSLSKDLGWNVQLIETATKSTNSPNIRGTPSELLNGPMSESGAIIVNMPAEAPKRPVLKHTDIIVEWPETAAFLGMNSCWRPKKELEATSESVEFDRGPWTLLLFALWFVWICSYLPALLLSYFTPLVGFACRSLSWTIIVALWTLAPFWSFLLRWDPKLTQPSRSWLEPVVTFINLILDLTTVRSARWLWTWATVVDAFNFLCIVLIVFAVQFGVFNNCYCRSGALTKQTGDKNYIDVTPPTYEEFLAAMWIWVAIPLGALVLIWITLSLAGSGKYSSQALLNRNMEEKWEDAVGVNNKRKKLWPSSSNFEGTIQQSRQPSGSATMTSDTQVSQQVRERETWNQMQEGGLDGPRPFVSGALPAPLSG